MEKNIFTWLAASGLQTPAYLPLVGFIAAKPLDKKKNRFFGSAVAKIEPLRTPI